MKDNINIKINKDPCEFITLKYETRKEKEIEVHIPTVMISDNKGLKLRLLENLIAERDCEVAEEKEINTKLSDRLRDELIKNEDLSRMLSEEQDASKRRDRRNKYLEAKIISTRCTSNAGKRDLMVTRVAVFSFLIFAGLDKYFSWGIL